MEEREGGGGEGGFEEKGDSRGGGWRGVVLKRGREGERRRGEGKEKKR